MKDQPYPIQYIRPILLKDGTLVQLRPIHHVDGDQAAIFKATLSNESLNSRFFGHSPKITKSNIKKYVDIDYNSEMAIIAEVEQNNKKVIIGIGRIAKHYEYTESAEFGIIISDKWHGKQLGHKLTSYMIYIAMDMRYKKLYAYTYSNNLKMMEILKAKNFELLNEDPQTTKAILDLDIFDPILK